MKKKKIHSTLTNQQKISRKQFLAQETIGKKMYGEEEEAKSQKNMV